MTDKLSQLVDNCQNLIRAYNSGELGSCDLPEDRMPNFGPNATEGQLVYFTLPMALNYRRNSTQLWDAALATYNDLATKSIYSISYSAQMTQDELQAALLKHKMAMQPNRHTLTWSTIAKTIDGNWGTLNNLLEYADYDFVSLREIVQHEYHKGFPYLAGPKLFNYWSFILGAKCGVELKNKELIDIAVDSHVLKCSVRLGLITADEADTLSTEAVAKIWRKILSGTGIAPTSLNIPLWFWSRNGFTFEP